MCKINSPEEKKKKTKKLKNEHGMFKRKTPHKNEASTGCVRETPHRKVKPAPDV